MLAKGILVTIYVITLGVVIYIAAVFNKLRVLKTFSCLESALLWGVVAILAAITCTAFNWSLEKSLIIPAIPYYVHLGLFIIGLVLILPGMIVGGFKMYAKPDQPTQTG